VSCLVLGIAGWYVERHSWASSEYGQIVSMTIARNAGAQARLVQGNALLQHLKANAHD
jgi:hypothetical protein